MDKGTSFVKQWRDDFISSIILRAVFMLIFEAIPAAALCSISLWFLFIHVILLAMYIRSVILYYKDYKIHLRLLKDNPELDYKLKQAYWKAYETQSTKMGVLTEYGIVTENDFAPWHAITSITVKPQKTRISILGGDIDQTPCYMLIDVKLDEKTCYSIYIKLVQYRDVADEIQEYLDTALKYNNRIFIDNTYVYVN